MSAASMKEEEEVGVVVPLIISGYRFLPTDLELVRDYLCKKITNQKLPSDVPVVEYDIYSTEPWNLPVNNIIDTINSKRSYYFVKLLDGIHRRQRIVNPRDDHTGEGGGGGGYWKKNIADCRYTRYIFNEAYRSIGVKKSFAFHAYLSSPAPAGRHTNNNNNIKSSTSTGTFADHEEDDGTTTTTSTAMTTWKTNWIMDEYSLNSQRTQPWVLCILSKKKGGGEAGDEIELLSKLKQVQQQQEKLQEPNHVSPERELQLLEMIKTTKESIKTNQKQIWEDQIYMGMFTKLRVVLRLLKQTKIIDAREERFKQIKDEFSKDKITIEESQELVKQLWEEYERKNAALEAEIAVIWAESSYVVQLPSNFRRKRRGNRNNFH